jgi:hypothetical protein
VFFFYDTDHLAARSKEPERNHFDAWLTKTFSSLWQVFKRLIFRYNHLSFMCGPAKPKWGVSKAITGERSGGLRESVRTI